MISVDEKRCTGCGACESVCPTGAIRVVDGLATVDQSKCRGCEVCLSACPEVAIHSTSRAAAAGRQAIGRPGVNPQAMPANPVPGRGFGFGGGGGRGRGRGRRSWNSGAGVSGDQRVEDLWAQSQRLQEQLRAIQERIEQLETRQEKNK